MAQNLGNLFIDGEDVIEDETGNHSITAVGGAAISTSEKKFGDSSIYFDGINDYLTIPHHADFELTNGNFTYDFWWYPTDLAISGRSAFISKVSDSNMFAFAYERTSGKLCICIADPDWGTDYGTKDDFSNNTWYHLAVVRNGTGVKIYVDGVEDFSVNIGTNSIVTDTSALQIGEWGGVQGWKPKGYLDNIRITKGTALWTSDFDVDDTDAMFYTGVEENPYIRPDLITELYNTGSRGNLRGKASEGFIRPTIKQFFTSEDFEETPSLVFLGYGDLVPTWETGDVFTQGNVVLTTNDSSMDNLGNNNRNIAQAFKDTTGGATGTVATSRNRSSNIMNPPVTFDVQFTDEPKTVIEYTIRVRSDRTDSAPRNWLFQGSTNGIGWATLDTKNNISWSNNQKRTYTITSPEEYSYYRLSVSSSFSARWLDIDEIELIGALYG